MRKLIYLVLFGALLTACSNNADNNSNESSEQDDNIEVVNPKDVPKEDRIARIRELEEELRSGGDQPDKKLARKLMGAYIDFGNFQREEPETPEFLFRGGDLARYIGRPKTAIELYTSVFNSFPEYERRVEALNWIAFIYDYDLKDKEKAEHTYAQIIELFPDHKLADDARARLETIDLSDEELIELFKQKNAAQ